MCYISLAELLIDSKNKLLYYYLMEGKQHPDWWLDTETKRKEVHEDSSNYLKKKANLNGHVIPANLV